MTALSATVFRVASIGARRYVVGLHPSAREAIRQAKGALGTAGGRCSLSLSMSHNSDGSSPALRPVAALCVSGRSIYKHLPGVVAFDRQRDARSFAGDMPAIAHPPCRLWSKFLSAQAKSSDPEGERELGRWCVRTVLRCGGVLEQPAGSRLWSDMRLPLPHRSLQGDVFTLYVEQSWFGYASRKGTWLLVVGVPFRELPPLPFRLPLGTVEKLSRFGRSRTVTAFAEWLVAIARRANAPAVPVSLVAGRLAA